MEDEDGPMDGEVKTSPGTQTISRIIGVQLANGQVIQAPLEVWLTAILQTLSDAQLQNVAANVSRMLPFVKMTPLDDGMAIVTSPIKGLSL